MSLQSELDRCDQEIAEMRAQTEIKPAWLVTLGIEDWEREKHLILTEDCPTSARTAGTRNARSSNLSDLSKGD